MPTYLFKRPDGTHAEVVMAIAEMTRRGRTIEIDGVQCERDIVAEMGSFGRSTSGAWPLKSDAAGVHPSQCREASEADARLGVPTDYDSGTGEAIFRDRGHRRDWLKKHGMHDRSGGYGDG